MRRLKEKSDVKTMNSSTREIYVSKMRKESERNILLDAFFSAEYYYVVFFFVDKILILMANKTTTQTVKKKEKK